MDDLERVVEVEARSVHISVLKPAFSLARSKVKHDTGGDPALVGTRCRSINVQAEGEQGTRERLYPS